MWLNSTGMEGSATLWGGLEVVDAKERNAKKRKVGVWGLNEVLGFLEEKNFVVCSIVGKVGLKEKSRSY